jgi:hypothetical protein
MINFTVLFINRLNSKFLPLLWQFSFISKRIKPVNINIMCYLLLESILPDFKRLAIHNFLAWHNQSTLKQST